MSHIFEKVLKATTKTSLPPTSRETQNTPRDVDYTAHPRHLTTYKRWLD